MKNIISEMRNSVSGISSRADIAEEVNKLDSVIETCQNEAQRKQRGKIIEFY